MKSLARTTSRRFAARRVDEPQSVIRRDAGGRAIDRSPRAETFSSRGVSHGTTSPQACEVLADLRAPVQVKMPRASLATAGAILTLGVGPALVWGWRFRRVIADERRCFGKLAAWAGHAVDSPASAQSAADVRWAADNIRTTAGLFTLLLFGVVLAAASVFAGLVATTGHTGGFLAVGHIGPFHRLMGLTYGFFWERYTGDAFSGGAWVTAFAGWSTGLAIAYAAHFAQVQLHARNVRGFLDALDRQFLDDDMTPVFLRPVGFGFSPRWWPAAAALVMLSGGWAILFAMAGAVDRRYRLKVSPGCRAELVAHLSETLHTRSATLVNVTNSLSCRTAGCAGSPRGGSRFCPNCGRARPTLRAAG